MLTLLIRLLELFSNITLFVFIEVKDLLSEKPLAITEKSNRFTTKFECQIETIMEEDEEEEQEEKEEGEEEETSSEHEWCSSPYYVYKWQHQLRAATKVQKCDLERQSTT